MDTELEMIVAEEPAPPTSRIRLVIDEPEGPVPFVRFKPYRYEYKLELIELAGKIAAGEATEQDDLKFLMKMVADWNLLDAESGERIPVGEYLRLTTLQIAQVSAAWSEYQALIGDEVKKTRGGL